MKKIAEYLENVVPNRIPCIDLRVFHHGKEVYAYRKGTDDYRRQRPVSEDTLFWIYSMTKPITMTAVMQCVERGLIGLDDPVSKYIPAFADMKVKEESGAVRPAKNAVTVRHLMSMSGGLDYDLQSPSILEAARDPHASTLRVVEAMAEKTLLFDPGEGYRYSLCHDVAAAVVEAVSGMTFGEYAKKNIFDPLGMKDTTFRETPENRERLAAQYATKEEGYVIFPFRNQYMLTASYDSGGAGLITSAADYGKFVSAMSTAFGDENPILGKDAINEMRRPQLSDELLQQYGFSKFKQGYSYGLGVRTMLHPDKANARCPVGEFGWDGAAGSVCMIDPDHEIAMCYLTSIMGSQFSYFELFPTLRDMIYEELL